jgi:hypothetical protein
MQLLLRTFSFAECNTSWPLREICVGFHFHGTAGARLLLLVMGIFHERTYKLCVNYCLNFNNFKRDMMISFEVMCGKCNFL